MNRRTFFGKFVGLVAGMLAVGKAKAAPQPLTYETLILKNPGPVADIWARFQWQALAREQTRLEKQIRDAQWKYAREKIDLM